MGRILLACLVPLLLACLALSLAYLGAMAQVGAVAVVLLVAAGALFAAACFKAIGAAIHGSFARTLENRGEPMPVSPEEVARSRRVAVALSAAGAACLVAAFAAAGPVLVRLLMGILSL
ncbi:hypothetical protein AAK967_01645 [Atopobiaceae bacterium 24-176]